MLLKERQKGREEEEKDTQLLDDLKEKRRYCNMKEEVLDRTLWRTRLR